MLRGLETLEKGFEKISKRSKKECYDELERMRQLIFVGLNIDKTLRQMNKSYSSKMANSLVYWCHVELVRMSAHVIFLSCNGLYRNAFDNIRYILEGIVQAQYLDLRHADVGLPIKIEILKEVEDKREYHAVRLIDELEIGYKDRLRKEYKQLSRIIHPTHEQPLATLRDVKKKIGIPAIVDCR